MCNLTKSLSLKILFIYPLKTPQETAITMGCTCPNACSNIYMDPTTSGERGRKVGGEKNNFLLIKVTP
jgi:hypothetical protein